MSIELKIKSKHLALEPAIIRREEQKLLKQARYYRKKQDLIADSLSAKYNNLHRHRTIDVRNESRATHLARAFIAGKKYKHVEQKCIDINLRDGYITHRIVSMVRKYHPDYLNKDLSVIIKVIFAWFEGD